MKIAKRFEFSASHRLSHLPEDHKCHNLHGHNYVVEVVLAGSAKPLGMVVDYGEISTDFGRWLDEHVDHKHLLQSVPFMVDRLDQILNEHTPNYRVLGPTTAECLAEDFWNVIQQFSWSDKLLAVRVSETPGTWAEYGNG